MVICPRMGAFSKGSLLLLKKPRINLARVIRHHDASFYIVRVSRAERKDAARFHCSPLHFELSFSCGRQQEYIYAPDEKWNFQTAIRSSATHSLFPGTKKR